MMQIKGKWQVRIVESERDEISAQLAQIESVTGIGGVRIYLNRKITELAEVGDHRSQLKRFIYLLHLLDEHAKQAFLKPSEVNDTISLLRNILRLAGVDATSSRLSFIHSELNQIVSKIYSKQHDLWTAAWTQFTAISALNTSSEMHKGKHYVALGNRMLRLGHTTIALNNYREALRNPLSERQLAVARVGIIRANRLSGNVVLARLLLAEFKKDYDIQSTPSRYLVWEEACIDVSEFQSFDRMFDAVKSGSTHHAARYLLEATFWARTMLTRDTINKLPKASSIARKLDVSGSEILWKIAEAIENCLDPSIDLTIRTNALGKRLAAANKLASINQEMLVYLAAARVLSRVGAFEFASLCLAEYVARSLRTSGGLDDDILKLGGDLLNRPWFKHQEDSKLKKMLQLPILVTAS